MQGPSRPPQPSPDLRAPESIGAYLARQRTLRGIGLDELETLTRIPRRSLERLESGQFDASPDGFVRGFVRTVAAALGLDPDETVTRMLREPVAGGPARPRGPGRWLGALALAALAGGVALAVSWWGADAPQAADATAAVASEPVRLRRDPVRALAEAQGLAADAVPPVASAPRAAAAAPAPPAPSTASSASAPSAAGPVASLPSADGPDRDAGAGPARR